MAEEESWCWGWRVTIQARRDVDVIRDLSFSAGELGMIPVTDFVLDSEWLPVVIYKNKITIQSGCWIDK